jgi:hypothetical protein
MKDEDLELDLFFILLCHIILVVLPLEIILIEELVSCATIRMLQERSRRRIISVNIAVIQIGFGCILNVWKNFILQIFRCDINIWEGKKEYECISLLEFCFFIDLNNSF